MEDSNRTQEAFVVALRYLARRAYFSAELREKLQKKLELSSQELDQVIQRLKDLRLLNDQDRLGQFLRYQALARGQGPLKLGQKLKPFGFSNREIRSEWENLELSEQALAEELLEKNAFRWDSLTNEKRKTKVIRFLAARGFSLGLAIQLAKKQETN